MLKTSPFYPTCCDFSLSKQFSGDLSRRGVQVNDSEAFCGRWSLKNPEILFNANDTTASGTIYSPILLQTYSTVSTTRHLSISSSLMGFSRMKMFFCFFLMIFFFYSTFLMYTCHFVYLFYHSSAWPTKGLWWMNWEFCSVTKRGLTERRTYVFLCYLTQRMSMFNLLNKHKVTWCLKPISRSLCCGYKLTLTLSFSGGTTSVWISWPPYRQTT